MTQLEGEGMGNYYLTGIEFQFCKMGSVTEIGCTAMPAYLMLLNCTLKYGSGSKFKFMYISVKVFFKKFIWRSWETEYKINNIRNERYSSKDFIEIKYKVRKYKH